eukprot:7030983-Prymnesium_polylepis.2
MYRIDVRPSSRAWQALAAMRTLLSEEEMRERAEQAQERLEEAGETSTVDDRQPDGPAPSFDSLVGRMIEVRWGYWVKEPKNKSGRRRQYIWCEGEVVEVADGKTTKKTQRCEEVLPVGCRANPVAGPDAERGDEETFVWSVL